MHDAQPAADLAARPTASATSALDAQYGVTAGLNLDVTVNTDFAQVEVDEQQVNLTRFGLFFPEKRDFFLENSELFTMGTGSAFTSTPVQTDLFFSRRIGLSDTGHADPDHRRRAPGRQVRAAQHRRARHPDRPVRSAGRATTSSSAATAATC